MAATKTIDVLVSPQGSIYLLRTLTPEAETWIEENVALDEAQYWGGRLVIEHRYILSIIDGLQAAGFVVKQGF